MGRRRNKRKQMSDINVVPYIDVMLVLLVVFMVTAPLLMQGVKVELPDAPSKPLDDQDTEPLIVSVKSDGSFYVNLGKENESAVSLENISERVGKVLKSKPDTQVLVWGDEGVPYGTVVKMMTTLQAAGAPSVGLVTESPE